MWITASLLSGKRSFCFIALLLGLIQGITIKGIEANEGSFYGESYILNPVQDASSTTSISLEFRTHRPQGLLLLAVGQTDYVIIQLNSGTVETRVNLGSGEAVTFSARGVRLDDSKWHSLVVNRTQDTVYLNVDGTDQGQATTPGTYHDLNIDVGVLLGGHGNLKESIYKKTKSFRGCLRDVFFNGINILEEARALKSAQNAFQVSWYCDDEFTAESDSPISFSHETSFVAFPHLRIYPQSSGVISCELKTRSSDAVILFNAGTGSTWEDFIAVELVGGRPKLSINKGSGVIEVVLEIEIDDGEWHKLEVTVSDSVAELQVDSEKNVTRFHLGGQNYLNLAGHLFVGGVGVKARNHAVNLGLASLEGNGAVKGSMIGCVRDISMNSRSYGFQQIQMSRLIEAGCGWEFPCAKNPCVEGAQCTELDGSQFRCDCGESVCVKEEFQSGMGNGDNDLSGVVSVSDLRVREGSSAFIDLNVVNIRDDFLRDPIREENIVFTIKESPQFGVIEVENRRGDDQTFTLRDLMAKKVQYRHQGGQSRLDSVTMEMSLNSLSNGAESGFRNRYDFVLPVKILSQGDLQLKVKVPSGNILPVTLGSRIRISTSVLDVEANSDGVDPSRMTFTVSYLRQASSLFQHSNEPQKSITSFTLQDVKDGTIWFQHSEDNMVYTKVSVTDGILVSQAVDLRFKEVELTVSVKNNTGISVSYGTDCLITPYNLSSVTNVPLEKLEVRYHVTKPPVHGALQGQEYETSEWMDVETFTQRHIDSGRLRYLHLPDTKISNYDGFEFEVMSKDVKISVQSFNIVFKTLTLTLEENSNLVLHQTSFGKFTEKNLKVVVNAEGLDLKNIVYSIIRAPQKGSIYLIKQVVRNPVLFDQITPLKTDETFTQQDVNNGFVYYKYSKPSFESSDDFTDLQASYFGFTVIARSVMHYSAEKTPVQFINNGLKDVMEGGLGVISSEDLSLEMDTIKKFTFSIVRYPSHGTISIVEPRSFAVLRHNVSSFTMSDIKQGQIAYIHDDSEHKDDSFTFSAAPILDDLVDSTHGEIQEYSGTFHITIKMKNDNPPVRNVSKVFHIAEGQVKHITIDDLAFMDPDIDYDDSLLHYQRQTIPNGEILSKATEEAVYNFTQADLIRGALLFQHRGDSYSRVPLLVSDGQFFSTTVFEIQASPPYIKISNNTGMEVPQGQYVTLSGHNLSIETNVDFTPEKVIFQLIEEPRYGHIRANGQQVQKFSYSDLLGGQVRYWQDGGNYPEDQFTVAALLESVQTQTVVSIRIVADGTSEPPEIVHNQILRVRALQSETISNNILQVYHRNYNPGDLEYIITQLPQHGHLVIKGRKAWPGSAPEFTQQDINDGQIVYASDNEKSTSDSFFFDVGTDAQSLRQIQFLIEVIPTSPHIYRANVSVTEGGSVVLSDRNIPFRGGLVHSQRKQFKIDSAPVHGRIVVKNGKKSFPTSTFTSEDASQGWVSYVHDNSESLNDEFTLRESDTGQLYYVFVNITSLNDQPPRITINTGLDLWTGSLAQLTSKHLQASDPDSSSEQVEFHVTAPTNGHLAFLNNTFKQISKFTQLDLDNGQVVFVHKGSEFGEFKFQATDGTNNDELRVFQIRARPVQIFVSVNTSLQAFPNTFQPITNRSLLAKTSASNFSHPIVFTVVEPRPTSGRLITLINEKPVPINSFTQDDINEEKIYFQHTGYIRTWEESVEIYLEITTIYAQPLTRRAFSIDISFININEGNYRELLNIKEPSLREGEKITITSSYFDSTELLQRIKSFKPSVTISFSFVSPPIHGYLWYKDRDTESGEEFTQDDLNNQLLVYKHDHSDTVADAFQFTVKILVPRSYNEPSTSVALNFNFTFVIEPINDQGFELITRHPKIEVTQGSEVVVTAHNLTTVDLDTGPEGIEYVILTKADIGMLVRSTDPHTRIHSFTQQEINDGMIIFKHDGTKKASGSIYIKVWDTVFDPQYANIDIAVKPLVIDIARDRYLPLIQGRKSVALSNEHLKVSTNGNIKNLHYKVTQAPQFGKLRKYNAQVTEFSQADIDSGQLLYIQDKDSPGDDFFVCNIDLLSEECKLDAVQFDIIMQPLVNQGPLITSPGSHVAITRSSLDASELAQITGDNPRFDIVGPPRYGRIMKRHRHRRQAGVDSSFQPVSTFTFEDIVYTKVYYVPYTNTSARGPNNDRFVYVLSAKGVPPARGDFLIRLDAGSGDMDTDDTKGKSTVRYNNNNDDDDDDDSDSDFYPTGDETDDDYGDEEDVKAAGMDPQDGDDSNIVIIATVLTILLLIIIAVVVVFLFLRWRRQNQAAAVQEVKPVKPRPIISGPIALEQPHVLIEPKNEGLASPGTAENKALVGGYDDENHYVNASHDNSSHEAESLLHPSHTPSSSSRSPDVTRVEYSQTVQGCKVTPMLDTASQSDQMSEDMERRSTMTSGRGSNASDLMEWTLMDPDLLQHCRNTTPVLRTNQYWL